jgi:hypothetical protein
MIGVAPTRRADRPPRWARLLARLEFAAAQVPGAPKWLAFEFLFRVASRHRAIHGIRAGAFGLRRAGEVWSQLERALSLIERIDPRRYGRICQDVRRILVVPREAPFMSMLTSTVFLARHRILGCDASSVALDLVHEAAHVRLHRTGLHYWPDLQQRMEGLCIREEIAFVGVLPKAGYKLKEGWLAGWDEYRRTYPATKGTPFYRWLMRRLGKESSPVGRTNPAGVLAASALCWVFVLLLAYGVVHGVLAGHLRGHDPFLALGVVLVLATAYASAGFFLDRQRRVGGLIAMAVGGVGVALALIGGPVNPTNAVMNLVIIGLVAANWKRLRPRRD